jgi:hypothetical protein
MMQQLPSGGGSVQFAKKDPRGTMLSSSKPVKRYRFPAVSQVHYANNDGFEF